MAQVVEESEKGHHHNHMSNFQRDPLKGFMALNHHHHLPLPLLKLEKNQPEQAASRGGDVVDGDEEEELELSLGLSMNGRFGVDPTAKKIKRTTSIPEFVKPVRDEDMGYVMPVPCTSLMRTCSLPTETEEEWRKRKELQTLRRLEARRKRSEKQRNLKAMRERNRSMSEEVGVGVGVEGNNNYHVEQGAGGAALNEFTSLRRTTSLTSRVGGLGLNGEKEEKKGGSGLPPPSPPQGSFGSSQGTGSSGISESESQQGTKPVDASRSPIRSSSLPKIQQRSTTPLRARIAAMTVRGEFHKHSPPQNRTKDVVGKLLEDMPCVSTKGEGPNGKRTEGFLYRYGKGEEVRIVCVCHGSFLTPAEFVKHAGGGDVANPLKHIVVSPSML